MGNAYKKKIQKTNRKINSKNLIQRTFKMMSKLIYDYEPLMHNDEIKFNIGRYIGI